MLRRSRQGIHFARNGMTSPPPEEGGCACGGPGGYCASFAVVCAEVAARLLISLPLLAEERVELAALVLRDSPVAPSSVLSAKAPEEAECLHVLSNHS